MQSIIICHDGWCNIYFCLLHFVTFILHISVCVCRSHLSDYSDIMWTICRVAADSDSCELWFLVKYS